MSNRALTDLRVLVVDDAASVRMVATRLLASLGVGMVECADGGAEAARILEAAREPFDVVLCDLCMPGEDGLMCLRRFARLTPKPNVIVMSGKDSMVLESTRRFGASLDLPILGTISKPLTEAALGALLRNVEAPSPVAPGATPAVPTAPISRADIERGLEERRFELRFQPQYNLASRRVVGVEALLRLRDKDRGLLGPASFIRSAEEHGLIGRLTDFVLEEAVAWCAAWQAADTPLTVAINLSKVGLNDLTLPDRAAALCATFGLGHDKLVFELTESSLILDATAVLDITTRLRLKGFRLSLDDFGTGYASLEELRSLPFHELKLDKQFVQDAIHSPRARAILENTVRLASELKMPVVAEGVETHEMLELVESLGCQFAQGYLLGKPMPPAEFASWLRVHGVAPAPLKARPARVDRVTPATRLRPLGLSQSAARPLEDTVLQFTHDAAGHLTTVLGLSEVLLSDATVTRELRDDIGHIHAAAKEVSDALRALRAQAADIRDRSGDSTPQMLSRQSVGS